MPYIAARTTFFTPGEHIHAPNHQERGASFLAENPVCPSKGREFQPCKLRAKLQTYFEKQDNSNNNNVLTT